jgi:hypothetical protein
MDVASIRDGSCIHRHDLFYGHDNGTITQRTACIEAANLSQILGKFERIGFDIDLSQIPLAGLTLQ